MPWQRTGARMVDSGSSKMMGRCSAPVGARTSRGADARGTHSGLQATLRGITHRCPKRREATSGMDSLNSPGGDTHRELALPMPNSHGCMVAWAPPREEVGIRSSWETWCVMPRQRTQHSSIAYVLPDDFPQRLERFQREAGLSWSEIARRLGTYRHTVWRWKDRGVRPSNQHWRALLALADSLGLGGLFID